MTACEDPAKANPTHNEQRRGNHDHFPKGRWHFGRQQVCQQPIASHYGNSMPAWKTREVHDVPDLSWRSRASYKGREEMKEQRCPYPANRHHRELSPVSFI